MCDAAIVTGASSGIGFEISRTLCGMGYRVFGIGRNFDRLKFQAEELETDRFYPLVCDITDMQSLLPQIKKIASENRICILVNNAGTAYYGMHEELNPKKIRQMVRTNLEAPMILTQQLLRDLKKNQGYVINIASVTAKKSSPHGCAYGATKAGLASFAESLFDETRKYGVKVTTIYPDMTKTDLYRNADFTVGEEETSYLMPQEIAEAVACVLNQRDGLVVSELVLKPQIHRIKKKP